ncbi:MAG: DUF4290 domain-containing protein [Marinilabiliaceae bacterium]|nr:DUF4290 domain-containing protein [Marinilabiliaceae bacterium]
MDYNSNRKKLVLPEYGRHVQKMVDHALTIEDREERMKCAKTIIGIMGSMFPHLRDVSDFKHKLWDHLAIMSNFKLDIDYPFDLPEAATFNTKPATIPYKNNRIRFMHYGKVIEEIIQKAIDHENEEEKKQLIQLIANHMKKSLMMYNKDSSTDERVFDDIRMMSGGKLQIEEGMKIPEFKDVNGGVVNSNSTQFHRNNRKRRIVKK